MTSRLLLDAARNASEPTPEEHRRNQHALAGRIGAGAFAASSLAAKTTGAALAGSAMGGALKIAVVPVLCAAIGVTGYVGVRKLSPRFASGQVSAPADPRATRPVAPVEVRRAAPEVAEQLVPAPIEGALAPATPPPVSAPLTGNSSRVRAPSRSDTGSPAAPPAPARAGGDLALELSALEEAQRALKAGDPRRAIAIVDAPSPGASQMMGAERQALRVIALCSLGEGKSEAKRFLDAQGSSPLAARVRKACDR